MKFNCNYILTRKGLWSARYAITIEFDSVSELIEFMISGLQPELGRSIADIADGEFILCHSSDQINQLQLSNQIDFGDAAHFMTIRSVYIVSRNLDVLLELYRAKSIRPSLVVGSILQCALRERAKARRTKLVQFCVGLTRSTASNTDVIKTRGTTVAALSRIGVMRDICSFFKEESI